MPHRTRIHEQLVHDLQVHQSELQSQNEELRRAQLALEESRARYFDLYDLAPVGYLTVADNGVILEANLCAATLLGVLRSELVNRSWARFIGKAHQDTYYLCHQRLQESGAAQTCELQVLPAQGEPLWVKLSVSTIPSDTGTPVLRVVMSDISERVRLDEHLRETNSDLVMARLRADQASQAKSDFLSNMSHELRSPLNAILGFAQLIEGGIPPPTPTQSKSLTQILRGGWYLLSLVNDILDLASIESGKLSLAMEAVPLGAALLDCQQLIEPMAQSQAVRLSFAMPDGACAVQADPTRLKQVLINLLTNAIKYNRPDGTVEVSCSPAAPGRLRVNVRDTGRGLSTHQLAQLFEPFNRLGQQTSANEGTGIGLVVSQRLVQSMDGELGVQSTVGVGSTFWFELNLAPA